MGNSGSGASRAHDDDELLVAARSGNLKAVQAAVQQRGKEQAMEHLRRTHDGNQMYATHLAAEAGHAELLAFLVGELKGDLLARTARGNTPLHIAARSDKAECCKVLLRAGNDGWAKCRLLWIALRKDRFTNPSCAISVLPKDMIRLLSSYIMRDGFDFNKVRSEEEDAVDWLTQPADGSGHQQRRHHSI